MPNPYHMPHPCHPSFIAWLNPFILFKPHTPHPSSPLPAGVAGHAHRHWGSDYTEAALYVRIVSMCMLATSIVIACWSGYNFNSRANMLQ
jgi:hypothetical protein